MGDSIDKELMLDEELDKLIALETENVNNVDCLNVEDSLVVSDEEIVQQALLSAGKKEQPNGEQQNNGIQSSTTQSLTSSPPSQSTNNKYPYLQSFSITLDSIQILPHWEILDARIEALDERLPQRTLGSTLQERRDQKRKAEGQALIDEEQRRGLERKLERDRKKSLRNKQKKEMEMLMLKEKEAREKEEMMNENENGVKNENNGESRSSMNEEHDTDDINNVEEDVENKDAATKDNNNKNSYNGPCVIYLSPNEESKQRLNALRNHLQSDLFPMYNAFSPSSSVSPYPEQLPRKAVRQQQQQTASTTTGISSSVPEIEMSSTSTSASSSTSSVVSFRPLLPIARFATVDAAVKVAKVLQKTWDPLTFNVTDIQFVSRDGGGDDGGEPVLVDGMKRKHRNHDTTTAKATAAATSSSGTGFDSRTISSKGSSTQQQLDMDIPEVRHRSKHGTLMTKDRMALTSSGEVEDVSKQGIYGCDAMVMLWGEEPDTDIMDEEASLSMIMDQDDETGTVGGVVVEEALSDDIEGGTGDSETEYGDNENDDDDAMVPPPAITTTVDPRSTSDGKINYNEIFMTAEREYQRMQAHEELSPSRIEDEYDSSSALGTSNIEQWLDDEDDEFEDEGATVVIGRAQFFMGAMREFLG